MGFTRCILPERNREGAAGSAGIELVGVQTLEQALEHALEPGRP
jgi:hypothetical protein